MKKISILMSLFLILSFLGCNDKITIDTQTKAETSTETNPVEEVSKEANTIDNDYAPKIGKKAPPFTGLEDVYGNVYNLEDYLGTNVLLIFETTFCTYCAKEKPILEEFQAKYGNRITILTVDIGEDPETVKEHIEEKNIIYPWLLDRESWTASAYLTFGTPKHFFIDREGNIQDIIQGFAELERLEIGLQKLEEYNSLY